jgi:hypothetical protein
MYRTRSRTAEKLFSMVVPCVSMRMLMHLDGSVHRLSTLRVREFALIPYASCSLATDP